MKPIIVGRFLAPVLLVCVVETAAFAQEPPPEPTPPPAEPAAAPEPAPAPAPVPAGPKKKGDIEDVDLDKLLDIKLAEKLGTTTAVSRKDEKVIAAPATITTLDSDTIRHTGAKTIPELLRWVPGVQVVRNTAGNYAISLRGTGGIGGNNIVVLLDGTPLNNVLDYAVDWGMIPVGAADVDRIEVVRGPVSVIYGANAYTGVINIVTKDTALGKTAVAARAYGGLDNSGEPVSMYSGRMAYNDDRLRAVWFWNANWDQTNSSGSAQDRQDDWLQMAIGGRLTYKIGKSDQVSASFATSTARRSSLSPLVLSSRPTQTKLVLGSVRYEHGVGENFSVSTWGRFNYQSIDTEDESKTKAFAAESLESTRADVGADVSYRFMKGLSATAGATGVMDVVDAFYLDPDFNKKPRFGGGVGGTVTASPWEKLDLSVGGRGDVPTTVGTWRGSYRASAVYHDRSLAVRLAAATAYRAPSWVERTGKFRDTVDGPILLEGSKVNPPTNEAVELGVAWGPTTRLQIKPTVYYSSLRDVMIEDFGSLVRKTYRNDKTPHRLLGTELEATLRLRDDLSINGWGAFLEYFDPHTHTATIAVPEQNSTFTFGGRVQGTLLEERFGYGVGARYASDRTYDLRTGIPPQILDIFIKDSVALDAMAEVRPWRKEPVWFSLHGFTNFPHPLLESPLPGAGPLGTTVLVGLEYRRE